MKTEELRRTEKNQSYNGLFSYLFCWFWAIFCLFTAVKEIKQIVINGCEISIECVSKLIKYLYYTIYFSFYFLNFLFFPFYFFHDLFAIDCGFSRSTSVSTIFFFSFFLEYIFDFYFLKLAFFFSARFCHESKISLVCKYCALSSAVLFHNLCHASVGRYIILTMAEILSYKHTLERLSYGIIS